MSIISNITRGGQLQIHQLRMIQQIFNFAVIMSLLLSFIFFVCSFKSDISNKQGSLAFEYAKAKILLSFGKVIGNIDVTQLISTQKGQVEIKSRILVKKEIYYNAAFLTKKVIIYRGKQALLCFIICFGSISLVWFTYGKNKKKTDIIKGKHLVSTKNLAQELYDKKVASDIIVAGLPLVENSETQHIFVSGTTGSGKSNLFNIILPQVKARPNKAVIVDVTGQFVAKYYNPDIDYIFNPWDKRSINWDIWSDCAHESHYEVFATSFIQDQKQTLDDIWDKSSRLVLVEIMRKLSLKDNKSIEKLISIITESSFNELEIFLKDTKASKIISKEGERTAYSVLMNLISRISPLQYLRDSKNGFSFRKWVEDEESNNSWMFITARSDQIHALKPLITAATDISINAMLSLTPGINRRIWFIMDELPKLNKLPSLVTALAEGRKYGGCIMAGIQSIPQLTEIYGYSISQAMLDMFNSFFFFRCQNPQTSEWISKILGVVEQEDLNEQLSYGASTIKDGVSFSKNIRAKNLVLPIEVANLQNLEAYVKYASHNITKIKTEYQIIEEKEPGFILKDDITIDADII